MLCQISIGRRDQGTEYVASLLDGPLDELSKALSKDYGGTIEHLWISVELSPSQPDGQKPWPFRFQKRVVPSPTAKQLGATECHNVGHYSVRIDFLQPLPALPQLVCHVLQLVYASTDVLLAKSQRLGGFDARAFRSDFVQWLAAYGCSDVPKNRAAG